MTWVVKLIFKWILIPLKVQINAAFSYYRYCFDIFSFFPLDCFFFSEYVPNLHWFPWMGLSPCGRRGGHMDKLGSRKPRITFEYELSMNCTKNCVSSFLLWRALLQKLCYPPSKMKCIFIWGSISVSGIMFGIDVDDVFDQLLEWICMYMDYTTVVL